MTDSPDIPSDKGLGRRAAPDARDRQYLLHRPAAAATVTSKYWLSLGEPLDQGETSQCVIYATDKWLTTRPIVNPGFGTGEERARVYKEVQKLDEWDGEDYEGTSVRAAFKYLKGQGLCSEYRWAFDAETAIAHALVAGPVILGTDWHLDMFWPDANGYVWNTGPVAGGHAYTLIGANRKRKNPDGTFGAIRFINSWGSAWGEKGRAWMSFDVLNQLIRANGEAGVAVEVKRAAP